MFTMLVFAAIIYVILGLIALRFLILIFPFLIKLAKNKTFWKVIFSLFIIFWIIMFFLAWWFNIPIE